MLQVFNQINSRKLGEREFNVFQRFFNNWLFIFISVLTVVVQIVLVQYGGKFVRCKALTLAQHGMCIGIGFLSLINGLLMKVLLPARLFGKIHMKEEPMTDEEAINAFAAKFRKSFRQSLMKQGVKTQQTGADSQR